MDDPIAPAHYLLALDTSGRSGSVAVLDIAADGPQLFAQQSLPSDVRTARALVPALRDLLTGSSLEPHQIAAVAVASGPGSFTGLRIGVTVAKTWAYATQSALVEVNTLDVLAAQAIHHAGHGRVWAVLDAQRGDVFVACYSTSEQLPSISDPTQLWSADRWIASVRSDDLVVGPTAARYVDRLAAGVGLARHTCCQPKAATVGLLGARLFAAGNSIDPFKLLPRYHRASAAEDKLLF